MTTSLRCCTFLFYLLIWRQFHQWNFSGATATDEADFDDPFIFHVGCFLVAVVVVGPKGKAIESNKVHRIKSHAAGGAPNSPPHQQPIQPIQQEGLGS
jgi:hypothetical protein